MQSSSQQAVQQDVAGLPVGGSGVPDALFKLDVAIKPQLCRSCRRHADKVGLDGACDQYGIRMLLKRFTEVVFKLAGFVSSHRETGTVITFDV